MPESLVPYRSSRPIARPDRLDATLLLSALLLACGGGGESAGPLPPPPPPPPVAQVGDLSGTVRNQASSAPLAGAIVTIGDRQVRTGADGRFSFAQLPVRSTVLQAAAPGFGPFRATITVTAGANTLDVPMRLQQEFEFLSGAYALYVPPRLDTVRGVLLVAGGPDGRGFASAARSFDLEPGTPPELEPALSALRDDYQTLARERGLAILGLQRGRSADNMDAVLEEAATALARPELRDVPVLAHGMSAGTLTVIALAGRLPERVMGIVLRAPNAAALSALQDASGSVPTLVITAERDEVVDNRPTATAFQTYRASGALWALAEEPGARHLQLSVQTQQTLLAWFRSVLDQRLPGTAGGPIRPLIEEEGWLGDSGTRDIAPWAAFVGDRRGASWLPSQAAAEQWRALVR